MFNLQWYSTYDEAWYRKKYFAYRNSTMCRNSKCHPLFFHRSFPYIPTGRWHGWMASFQSNPVPHRRRQQPKMTERHFLQPPATILCKSMQNYAPPSGRSPQKKWLLMQITFRMSLSCSHTKHNFEGVFCHRFSSRVDWYFSPPLLGCTPSIQSAL